MMGKTSFPSGTAREPEGGRKSFWTSIMRSAEDEEDGKDGDEEEAGGGMVLEVCWSGTVVVVVYAERRLWLSISDQREAIKGRPLCLDVCDDL